MGEPFHRTFLRDTHRAMSAQSTTYDVVELVRATVDPINVGDLDAILYAPGAVWDMSQRGLGIVEERA
jgi:hypothetical protein